MARSTIYRHWPDAEAVVADALDVHMRDSSTDRSGDPEVDLRQYLHELRNVLESPAASIIIAQAEAAERDETAAETMSGNAEYRNSLIKELLDDPRRDFDNAHAQLVGPLFMRRFFIRQPITDALIDEVVEQYLDGRNRSAD